MNNCIAVNIQDMLMTFGEETVKALLSDFSCPLNENIEKFVHDNAIGFARQKLSVTYLVLKKNSKGENGLAGIFTLAHKAVTVGADSMTNTTRRKLNRFAAYDPESGKYHVSAFLIAQFGKNYAVPSDCSISGNELMNLAMDILEDAQHRIGGGVIYLDCENIDKVLHFYQNDNHRFAKFGERLSRVDGKQYLQLIKFF